MNTWSFPRTEVTVSVRDLREGAYRALRAAGVSAGVADDAAVDTAALELEYGCGLRILTALLEAGDYVDTPAPSLASSDGPFHVHSSGHLLLIAGPLADIVSAEPTQEFRFTGITEPIVMAPALANAVTPVDLCVAVAGSCRVHRDVDPTEARAVWADTSPVPPGSTMVFHAVPRAEDHVRSGERVTKSQRDAKWRDAVSEGVTVVEEVWSPFRRHVQRYLV